MKNLYLTLEDNQKRKSIIYVKISLLFWYRKVYFIELDKETILPCWSDQAFQYTQTKQMLPWLHGCVVCLKGKNFPSFVQYVTMYLIWAKVGCYIAFKKIYSISKDPFRLFIPNTRSIVFFCTVGSVRVFASIK